jgi:hypothetical protein
MNYFIAVEVKATGHIAALSAAIQRAFDGGADGNFKVLVTHAPSYMVIFERSYDSDEVFLKSRVEKDCITFASAAMNQLADELDEGGISSVAAEVLDVLKNGDAQCFDFQGGFEASQGN